MPAALPEHVLQQQRRMRAWVSRVLDAAETQGSGAQTPENISEQLAWQGVASAGRGLLRSADAVEKTDPAITHAIIFDLVNLLSGLLEGSRLAIELQFLTVSPSAQAARAREARKAKAPEQALLAAVQEAVANKTDADLASRGLPSAILGKVNAFLKRENHEAVSVHVVRRRLKSLRS